MDDINLVEMNMTENEVRITKKEKYKEIVKSKVRQSAFQYLKEIQQKHSKVKTISYGSKLMMAEYLKSPLFNSDNTETLLALRTRTVRGIRNDFSGMYNTLTCPLGCTELDTLPNLLSCKVLKAELKADSVATSDISYDDVFSSHTAKQRQVTELYTQLLAIREQLQNSPPVEPTGPVH